MLINFRKYVILALLLFVYVGKEEIKKYMKYEVSMTAYMGRVTNQRKIPNGFHLKTICQNH